MKKYTFTELNQMRITKGELFAELDKDDFDYALPQDWLNDFSDFCKKHNPIVTYDLIRSTTIWSYKDSVFGGAYTACTEVNKMLEKFYSRIP